MKKIFITFTSFGLIIGLTSPFCNIQENTKFKMETEEESEKESEEDAINILKKVNISHNIITGGTCPHDATQDIKTVFITTSEISWNDIISKANYVNVHGYFVFEGCRPLPSYAKPISIVKLHIVKSSKYKRVWTWEDSLTEFYFGNVVQSIIELSLKANYNFKEKSTALEMISKIYAPGSLGKRAFCCTTSEVNKIEFIY